MADGGWARSKAELMYGGGCGGVKAKLEGLAHRDETAMHGFFVRRSVSYPTSPKSGDMGHPSSWLTDISQGPGQSAQLPGGVPLFWKEILLSHRLRLLHLL